jgi:hypothetical protein
MRYSTVMRPKRSKFARRLVATTDKVFTFATADGPLAELLRTRIAPVVMPRLIGFDFAREYLFRTVSQIMLNYRDSPLASGTAGHVHGGDRLPWAGNAGGDNFTPLADPVWQIHVYGSVRPALATWCADRHLPLHRFDWSSEHETAGLARDAVYLIRPDTYVAVVDVAGTADTIERYFTQRGIRT